jgi:hypothetical protein
MDLVMAAVVVCALLVLVAVVALLVTRGPLQLTVRGPFRTGVGVEGMAPVGVRLRRICAGRDVTARGRVVDAHGLRAARDATFDDRSGQAKPPKG